MRENGHCSQDRVIGCLRTQSQQPKQGFCTEPLVNDRLEFNTSKQRLPSARADGPYVDSNLGVKRMGCCKLESSSPQPIQDNIRGVEVATNSARMPWELRRIACMQQTNPLPNLRKCVRDFNFYLADMIYPNPCAWHRTHAPGYWRPPSSLRPAVVLLQGQPQILQLARCLLVINAKSKLGRHANCDHAVPRQK